MQKNKIKLILRERGITMVALAVTIIIMLILAGVTLNVALGDGGLISDTEAITSDYEESMNKKKETLATLKNKLQEEKQEIENIIYFTGGESWAGAGEVLAQICDFNDSKAEYITTISGECIDAGDGTYIWEYVIPERYTKKYVIFSDAGYLTNNGSDLQQYGGPSTGYRTEITKIGRSNQIFIVDDESGRVYINGYIFGNNQLFSIYSWSSNGNIPMEWPGIQMDLSEIDFYGRYIYVGNLKGIYDTQTYQQKYVNFIISWQENSYRPQTIDLMGLTYNRIYHQLPIGTSTQVPADYLTQGVYSYGEWSNL